MFKTFRLTFEVFLFIKAVKSTYALGCHILEKIKTL